MNLKDSEVNLSINLMGSHARNGSYSHFHKVGKEGQEINGVRMDKAPTFTEAKKTIRLGNAFVRGALDEPTESLKHKMKLSFWRNLPEYKRIALHVGSYVKAIHPEHRGYTMELL